MSDAYEYDEYGVDEPPPRCTGSYFGRPRKCELDADHEGDCGPRQHTRSEVQGRLGAYVVVDPSHGLSADQVAEAIERALRGTFDKGARVLSMRPIEGGS